MPWHRRQYDCGSWLPEDKKRKCGIKRENAVAYCRLPSPAPLNVESLHSLEKIYFDLFHILFNSVQIKQYNLVIQKSRKQIGVNRPFLNIIILN